MTEITRTNIQKRSNDTLSETPLLRKKANKRGPKFDEVWQYYIQGDDINPGMVKGRPVALKAHLANECLACSENISKYWHDKLAENTVNYTQKMDSSQDQDQDQTPAPQPR
ncbi:hypothetical protein RhiirB3_430622, partial [Rhizophagus irregularis]